MKQYCVCNIFYYLITTHFRFPFKSNCYIVILQRDCECRLALSGSSYVKYWGSYNIVKKKRHFWNVKRVDPGCHNVVINNFFVKTKFFSCVMCITIVGVTHPVLLWCWPVGCSALLCKICPRDSVIILAKKILPTFIMPLKNAVKVTENDWSILLILNGSMKGIQSFQCPDYEWYLYCWNMKYFVLRPNWSLKMCYHIW